MLKRYIFFPILFLFVICFSSGAYSQLASPEALFVIPSTYTGTVGTATFTGPTGNTARTYQMIINSNQLTALVERSQHQLHLEIQLHQQLPSSDVTFTNYDIYLAQGVPPAERHRQHSILILSAQRLRFVQEAYYFGKCIRVMRCSASVELLIIFNNSYLYTGGHLVIWNKTYRIYWNIKSQRCNRNFYFRLCN